VGVEGIIRSIGAPSPQTVGGVTYQFASWSDGGAATHEGPTPVNDTTFTATFQAVTTSTLFLDEFNSNLGWVLNPAGTDTATTGRWQRGNPQGTSSGGVVTQLDPCDAGTANCLVTGLTAGSSAGVNDVDGGVTSIQSPAITLPASGSVTLRFAYYFAHLNNSSSADFFRVQIVGSGAPVTVFEELGAATNDAASWTTRTVSLNAFLGQTIRIRILTADAGTASLVEAAVDTVRVTTP
jgi:aminopeptidase S